MKYVFHVLPEKKMIKVTYDADTCVHAGECVKGAPNVFKVVDGQFVIDTSADSEENIRTTVGNCPSGALKIEE
jgi:uncharacterized Fe-S cluster protein YjdI